MEAWERAWLECKVMPPPTGNLPEATLVTAHNIAEEWLFSKDVRCNIEEWVSGEEAGEVLVGLLWSGFCVFGQEQRARIRPIPVLVKLLNWTTEIGSDVELLKVMKDMYNQNWLEWQRQFVKHGAAMRIAP